MELKMRRGPHPLSVHLGMAAANISGVQRYISQFNVQLSEGDAIEMVRGIQLYQRHSFKAMPLPKETIWESGAVTLQVPIELKQEYDDTKTPILFIPSLINKSHILDITEKKSVLRWFSQKGTPVYILDWGNFIQSNEGDISFDELITLKLSKAIQFVSDRHSKKVDVLGYCMGGTLMNAAYFFAQSHIRRMVHLASPWDFHAERGDLARNVRLWSPLVLPEINRFGYLPSEWIQALFASLDPNAAARKFIRFAQMDQDSEEAKLFVSVEDWLNDGINLPPNIAHYCIHNWFIENKTKKGSWIIGGRRIDLKNVVAPNFVVASDKDRLVSYECAASIIDSLPEGKAKILRLSSGHIGLIIGRQAIESVWKPVYEWLEA